MLNGTIGQTKQRKKKIKCTKFYDYYYVGHQMINVLFLDTTYIYMYVGVGTSSHHWGGVGGCPRAAAIRRPQPSFKLFPLQILHKIL
jgi:hypothetical protein